LGIEFLDAVNATIEQVVAMPRAGVSVRRLSSDLTVRRRAVTRFPYHVVYMEMPTRIRILAIAHDRRKPGYWKDRMK
jgi:toxin ParE1/3/4